MVRGRQAVGEACPVRRFMIFASGDRICEPAGLAPLIVWPANTFCFCVPAVVAEMILQQLEVLARVQREQPVVVQFVVESI